MSKQHWMISIVRMMAILFVFSGCLLVFWYTPFYSNLVVKALNTFVPVNVDVVAAQSQQMAALTDHSDYEPGSRLWIARQAYLDLMEQAIQDKKTEDLVLIQTRYQILLDEIKEKLKNKSKQESKNIPKIPFVAAVDSPEISTAASEVEIDEQAESIQNLKESAEDKALRETYTQFLETHPVDPNSIQSVDDQTYKDIALIQSQGDKKKASSDPHAIVILGGGLTLGPNKVDIVVNDYTRLRLEKTLEVEKESKLPIVLSGVEAPYMQAWLKNSGVEANLLENRSMNTCENTRFSSLLLQKKGGAPTVILITDRYHMPRTRRLFALNGIQTIPVEAPMPTTMTNWQPSLQNYDHSRRANYEMLASIRDVLFGSSGCREVP
ncbi:MAG: YdcF family protein [Acinetobacter sp.]|nr:YdcF family protein [Acinetobacter sp.]